MNHITKLGGALFALSIMEKRAVKGGVQGAPNLMALEPQVGAAAGGQNTLLKGIESMGSPESYSRGRGMAALARSTMGAGGQAVAGGAEKAVAAGGGKLMSLLGRMGSRGKMLAGAGALFGAGGLGHMVGGAFGYGRGQQDMYSRYRKNTSGFGGTMKGLGNQLGFVSDRSIFS